MDKRIGRQFFSKDDDVKMFEDYLGSMLTEVTPRQEFVRDLRARLVSPAEQRTRFSNPFVFVLLGGAGVLSSVVLVVTSLRAVVTLLGAFGVAHKIASDAKGGEAVALAPLPTS